MRYFDFCVFRNSLLSVAETGTSYCLLSFSGLIIYMVNSVYNRDQILPNTWAALRITSPLGVVTM